LLLKKKKPQDGALKTAKGVESKIELLLLMTILAKTLFTLMLGDFCSFSLFSAWH